MTAIGNVGAKSMMLNEILTLDTKAQMEAMEGVWIYELSEMSGLNKSEVERMKAFASRSEDRARMAYARFSVSRPRQAIFVGTTNERKYLKDRTGNRRFLPVQTGVIDLEALRSERDQLWAEAVRLEARGESVVLPKNCGLLPQRSKRNALKTTHGLKNSLRFRERQSMMRSVSTQVDS